MRRTAEFCAFLIIVLLPVLLPAAGPQKEITPEFHTSDRCQVCHNQLKTASGKDISIGFDWRASIMANSARDPYWQASVRREDIDHPESAAEVEDGCADCHMPVARYQRKLEGKLGQVFANLPFDRDPKKKAFAEDGVTCSICHQVSNSNFGTRQSFNGGFLIETPKSEHNHPEFGPFDVDNARAHIMQTSTGGFRPTEAAHIRDAALCATCHTLYTKSLGPGGKVLGTFPEQVPYQEWLHSGYPGRYTCQGCHMPEVHEPVHIAAVLGVPRTGMHQHTFTGGNFFLLGLLNLHRDELSVTALPDELTDEANRTENFLKTQAARLSIQNVSGDAGKLSLDVVVENLTGHKLPTAFPSRRAWLHVVIKIADGRTVFDSGALNANGSIAGNVNDLDALRFEPHFREITSSDQVEIYEPILRDSEGRVTTGLATAVGYLKDNRLLPSGFNKETADSDVSVVGDASGDPKFVGGSDTVRYSVDTHGSQGPFQISAELWYQPIGYRWAHNLASYKSFETVRFVGYYDSAPQATAIELAHAEARY